MMVQAASAIPMGRCSYGEDSLGLTLDLAGDASAYVAGRTLPADGGRSVYRVFSYPES